MSGRTSWCRLFSTRTRGRVWRSLHSAARWQQTKSCNVQLSRVGGVNAPVGSRDPVYNFLCC